MLEVKELHCAFGSNEVLKGVSFTVKDGEVATIIGGSGAGKTTVIRVLCGLEKMTKGNVVVDGQPAGRGVLGLVQQGCCLFDHMNVLQNVAYALRAVKKLPCALAETRAKNMLSQFGLSDKFDVYPSRLSGGQKQRVAIARTLVMEPKVLLFDEPTSALDPEMTSDVISMISNISKSGIAVVIVTHDLTMARRISDRVLFLEHGKIVEDRPSDDFFKCPATERAKNFLIKSACI